MRGDLNRIHIQDSILYVPDQGLVYLNNPKVACSTIKTSIWLAHDEKFEISTYDDDPHDRLHDPFVKNVFANSYNAASLANAKFFSVVRNPFVRTLSAYLDKIGSDRDPAIWGPFARRFRLDPKVTKAELSFRDFLIMICSEHDELLDPHFCPQYVNLLWPICRPAFVGRLEQMHSVGEFLRSNDVALETFIPHATKARDNLYQYYREENIELVRQKFIDDFRIFGYGDSLEDIGDNLPTIEMTQNVAALVGWVVDQNFPADKLEPSCSAFNTFQCSTSSDERLAIVTAEYQKDDNWQRLREYARFCRSSGLHSQYKEIFDKITQLTTRHCELLENKEILASRSSTAQLMRMERGPRVYGGSVVSAVARPAYRGTMSLEGYVGSYGPGQVAGWVWDSERPQDRLEIEVYLEDTLLGRLTAWDYRPDLADAGIGDGAYGFVYRHPALSADARDRVSVIVANTDFVLKRPPIVVEDPGREFCGRIGIPVPPRELRHLSGPEDLGSFLAVGEAFAQNIYPFLSTAPRILDVGCDCGKTARFLVANPNIQYVGVDVLRASVEWASRAFEQYSNRFRFEHIDIHSAQHNTTGRLMAETLTFPFMSNTFDLALCSSFFTHLAQEEIHLYLSEIQRCLIPGGLLIASTRIDDRDDQAAAAGNSTRIEMTDALWKAICLKHNLALHHYVGYVCGKAVYVMKKIN